MKFLADTIDHQQLNRWRRPRGRRAVFLAAVIAMQLMAVTWLVYGTGGTQYVWVHLYYLPVISAAAFSLLSGSLVGLLAGLLAGPFMPLDVNAGLDQQTANWLLRLCFLLFFGMATGCLFRLTNRLLDEALDQALIHQITGLPNQQALLTELQRLQQPGNCTPVMLAVVQFANRGEITATLGYAALREIGRQIIERFDCLHEGGHGAKLYSGDTGQFVILAVGQDQSAFKKTCSSCFSRLVEPIDYRGLPLAANVHFGAAAGQLATLSEELFHQATLALRSARQRGRMMSWFDDKVDDRNIESLELLGSLQRAIADDELQLYYQPKLDMQDGTAVAAEALVRWRNSHGELIEPARFIPQVEKTWLVHPLTLFVVGQALHQLEQWQAQGIRLSIAVNVTAANLQSNFFMDEFCRLATTCNCNLACLEVEITERTVVRDWQMVADSVARLKKMGVTFAIDDFGTGHASFALFDRLGVDTIKLDASYVANINSSEISRAYAKNIINMAHDIGIKTVAEGVENDQQLQLLRELGCDIGQGYYFSPPLAWQDFNHWLEQQPKDVTPLLEKNLTSNGGTKRH